jgi:hypothetical protein
MQRLGSNKNRIDALLIGGITLVDVLMVAYGRLKMVTFGCCRWNDRSMPSWLG